MFFKPALVGFGAAMTAFATPMAMPEATNSTMVEDRAVLNSNLYAIYTIEKWSTTVARKYGPPFVLSTRR